MCFLDLDLMVGSVFVVEFGWFVILDFFFLNQCFIIIKMFNRFIN